MKIILKRLCEIREKGKISLLPEFYNIGKYMSNSSWVKIILKRLCGTHEKRKYRYY